MKILLFYYYPGAGGKFIANCLASSKKVVLQDYVQAQTVLKDTGLDILTKLLLDTVPDKSAHSDLWTKFEKGCKQLFGPNIGRVKLNQPIDPLAWNTMDVFGDCWLPIMTHWDDNYINCKKFFKHATIYTVKINATPAFVELNKCIKNTNKLRSGRGLDTYETFQKSCSNLEFDYIIEDWDPRLPENLIQITNLAHKLGIDSFDLNSVKPYIDRYIDFHIR